MFVVSVIGFMNCSPAGNCSPANCGGCCDSTGTCVTSTTPSNCGRLGETCNACSGATNLCMSGVCSAGMTGGGMGGGGGTTGGGGGTTGGGAGGGSGGGTGGGGVTCAAFDFSQGQTIFAEYNQTAMGTPNHFAAVGAPSATPNRIDIMLFEGWYFDANENPTFPKTVMLPSPAMAKYWQCYDCLVLNESCDPMSGDNCARSYYVQGGSLTVTTATRNVLMGNYVATATNLNFVEWDTSDPDMGGDRPIPNGRCATVATVSLNGSWNETPDAGVDAGTDAGTIDAGLDAGIDVDAGLDAGTLDSGIDLDAGLDAGSVDAGDGG